MPYVWKKVYKPARKNYASVYKKKGWVPRKQFLAQLKRRTSGYKKRNTNYRKY